MAERRWRRQAQDMEDEPVREDLPCVGLRLTLQQPGRPMRILELRRKGPLAKRFWMFENDACCGTGGKCRLFRLAERSTVVG